MKYDMTIALDKKPIPKALNFIFGGVAGMTAAACCHPLDVLKNRMQLAGIGGTAKISAGQVFANIIRTEGMEAMYKGLTASLLRQATYSSARLGVYNGLLQIHKGPQGELPSLGIKASCGMLAGAVGAFIGTPAEVCLIRMTADGRLPPLERRNYKNVFNALARIINEEGITTLFRGFAPTVARGIVVNGIMLSTYSQAKQILIQNVGYKDGISVHVAASMLSGFNTAVTSLPLDIVKTRIQNMKIINGKPEYTGAIDALMKILNKEGATALWKGFTPYFSRVGPVAIITFVVLEAIEDFYRNFT